MSRTLVVGVDPGATTGICALTYLDAVDGLYAGPAIVLETAAGDAVDLIVRILAEHRRRRYETLLAVEQFVVSQRAAHSATAQAGQVTRELIAELTGHAPMYVRSAATVKPWATDRRLRAAGLYAATKGYNHARDAARHALYTAVKTHAAPDPLSVLAR